MRIIESRRGYFRGTHKGCEIEIEADKHFAKSSFYIRVRADKGGGGYLYDGYAPEGVTTMPQAKREALYGSCLEVRP